MSRLAPNAVVCLKGLYELIRIQLLDVKRSDGPNIRSGDGRIAFDGSANTYERDGRMF